jgi:ribosomal subunit interface protein
VQIITKVRHTELDQAIKDYAQRKIGEKCSQFLGDDPSVVCEIEFDDQYGGKGGQDKRVDVTVTLPHEHLPLHIEESDETFQAAIDIAVERLEKALVRHKETQKHL